MTLLLLLLMSMMTLVLDFKNINAILNHLSDWQAIKCRR